MATESQLGTTWARDPRVISFGSLAVSALIGAFYSWVITQFWGFYAIGNPIGNWLLAALADQGQETLYLIAVYSHDTALNILLAVPFASMFVLFPRLNSWYCLITAVLAAIVTSYWDAEWQNVSSLWLSIGFWIGFGMLVLSLPVAFAAIRSVHRLADNT